MTGEGEHFQHRGEGQIEVRCAGRTGKPRANPRPCWEQGGGWHRRKLSLAGERTGRSSRRRTEASERAGRQRLCGQERSSPDSESGEQWTPFGKANRVPGGKRTRGARKPGAVLSADICLSVCLSTTLCVCVCVPALSLVSFSSGASFSSLSSDLLAFPLLCSALNSFYFREFQ